MSFRSQSSWQWISFSRSAHETISKATSRLAVMIEMWTTESKCFLTVIFFSCVLFYGAGARATEAEGNSDVFYTAPVFVHARAAATAGAGAFGLSNIDTFSGALGGSSFGIDDRHKEIRSYDNRGFLYGSNANRGLESQGIPLTHGAGHDPGVKSGGYDHSKKGDDCSKCKWENDDYWERDEPEQEEEEKNEDDCDDDDGQYRPDKTYHYGGNKPDKGHRSRLPGVHKTGPTGTYDDGVNVEIKGNKPDGQGLATFGNTNLPVNTGYGQPSSVFGTTPKPGSNWNTGIGRTVGSSQKPNWHSEHDVTSDGSSGTTPIFGSNWNTGFGGVPTAGFPSPQKPAPSWNTGQGNIPGRTFGITPKPGSTWNTGYSGAPTTGFPSSQTPGPGWNTGIRTKTPTSSGSSSKPNWNVEHDGIDDSRFGTTPKPGLSWNTRSGNTPIGGFALSQKPEATWDIGHHGDTPDERFGITPKSEQGWNTGFGSKPDPSWNPNFGITSVGTSDCDQPTSNCNKQVPTKLGAAPGDTGFRKSDRIPSVTDCSLDANSPYGKCIPASTGPGYFPGAPHRVNDKFPLDNHAGLIGNTNRPYGQPGTPSISANDPHAEVGIMPSSGNAPYGGTFDFGRKGHPFGLDKPTVTRIPYGNDEMARPYGSGSTTNFNKPGYGNEPHTTWSTKGYGSGSSAGASSVASTFGISNEPQRGIGSSGTFPQDDLNSRRLPNFSSTSGIYGHPGVTKPSYESSTKPWPTVSHTGSTRNGWYGSGITVAHSDFPVSNTGFGTTKTPLAYDSAPGLAPFNPYSGTGSKQPSLDIGTGPKYSSVTANVHTNTFGTSPSTHSSPSITATTPSYSIPEQAGRSGYPGIPAGTRPTYDIASYNGQPGRGSGTWTTARPNDGSGTWPHKQFGGGSGTWPNRKSGDGTWSSGQSGIEIGTPGGKPESESGAWLNKQPTAGSGTWLNGKPESESAPWPGGQPGSGNHPLDIKTGLCINANCNSFTKPISGSGCQSANCRSSTGVVGGNNNCGRGNYNCPGSGGCIGRGNSAPAGNRGCGGTDGPSGVNKTYYPVGTGDGNVPSIGNTYGPGSPFNVGSSVYSGVGMGCGSGDNSCNQVGGAGITEGPVKWNSANPFLHGIRGGTPSDVSRPWNAGTTTKPLGKGNPFLESGWTTPKPGYGNSNINEDKNVIPLGRADTKSIGQDNPFLDGSKRRGDIDINPNERVIPLGEKIPVENNPFIGPSASGSSNPSVHDASNKDSSTYPSSLSYPDGSAGSKMPGSGNYGDVKGDIHPGGILPQGENSNKFYPRGGSSQSGAPLGCKQGLFGCGTPGSGSYATEKDGVDQTNNGNWPSSGGNNQGNPNSWTTSSVSAFASSHSGSWSRNPPVGVKG